MLKKYLKNNLIKKFIRVSSSSTVSSILFIKKFDEKLRFCVNYRKFNVIIIKNRYLLSLIRKILNCLIKTKFYIKFDIIVAFNKFRIIKKKDYFSNSLRII